MTPWKAAPIHDRAGVRKYTNGIELHRFLAAADALALPRRALCYLYAHSGCRLSEGLAIRPHSLNPEIGHATVTFRTLKRRKLVYRVVPVSDELMSLLLQLPVGEDGRFWPVHRVTAWRWIKATMLRAGIAGTMATTKGLRHGFGMRSVARNIPITTLQTWLGHASPITTGIYVNAVGDEERGLYNRMWQGLGAAAESRPPPRPSARTSPRNIGLGLPARRGPLTPPDNAAGLFLPAGELDEIRQLTSRLIHLVGTAAPAHTGLR